MYIIDYIIYDSVVNRTYIDSENYSEFQTAQEAFEKLVNVHLEESKHWNDTKILNESNRVLYITYVPSTVIICLKSEYESHTDHSIIDAEIFG